MKEDILEAKRRLYSLLIKLNDDIMSDNEIDIMFLLSKDEQIQYALNNSRNIDIFGTIMTCSPKYSNCQLCKYINEPQNSDVCTHCAKHNKSTEYYR